MVFPDLTLGLQRFSASDSVFFVAVEKNGFACSGRSGYEVRVRFCFSLPQRRTVPPAERHYPTATVILDLRVKLGNRCRDCPGLALLRAAIRDFRGQTWESLQEKQCRYEVKTCER